MKVTIKGFVLWKKDSWEKEGRFYFQPWQMEEHGYVTVMPHVFEIDVPDDFNPVPAQVAILEKEKARVRAEFNQRIAQLNEQIGKLQALTFDEVKS